MESRNSPFHFRAVEGREWESTDGGELTRESETQKRRFWADSVLGVLKRGSREDATEEVEVKWCPAEVEERERSPTGRLPSFRLLHV